MKFILKETWGYAVLLIILFAIAALAVWHTMDFVEEQMPSGEYRVVAVLIWALCLGFMLIAGAFGLWAIQFAAEGESRRRIGRLVETMDYLRDGLLVIDRRARITGANPAAKEMAKRALGDHEALQEVFACLREEDVDILLRSTEPNEIERKLEGPRALRVLRFRSQPSEGVTLILISDVTATEQHRTRSRQLARLQLIGQIARGVAHDFNSILCGISGHASLLTRVPAGSSEMLASIDAVTQGAERGIELAGHLLELSKPGLVGQSTEIVAEHVKVAAEILRGSLPAEWTVETDLQDLPPVPLTGIQIEQSVLNLGLLAADALQQPGVLRISLGRPGDGHLFNIGEKFAGLILVAASRTDDVLLNQEVVIRDTPREAGVIASVIRSMIEETGGALEYLSAADGAPIYRIGLPFSDILTSDGAGADLPGELCAYISHWSILHARVSRQHNTLDTRLDTLGAKIERVDNVMSALAYVEGTPGLDAIVIEKHLLRQETRGLLKAILKLRPSAGLVVLSEDPEAESDDLASDVMFVAAGAKPDAILLAMIEAKSLAVRRKQDPQIRLPLSQG